MLNESARYALKSSSPVFRKYEVCESEVEGVAYGTEKQADRYTPDIWQCEKLAK